jgi:hypothetical protein
MSTKLTNQKEMLSLTAQRQVQEVCGNVRHLLAFNYGDDVNFDKARSLIGIMAVWRTQSELHEHDKLHIKKVRQ